MAMLWPGRRRSYAEAVENRRKTMARLGVLVLFFVAFELLTGLFLAAYSIRSSAMAPTVAPGDLVVATPLAFGPRTPFGKLPGVSRPERGDLVLAEPPFSEDLGFWRRLADSFVRFLTFQRLSLSRSGGAASLTGPMLERVVGLPGDIVVMEDFVFKVKTEGSDHFLTEFELSRRRYDISKAPLPAGWKESFPASGTMAALTLDKDQYFLAGDSRSGSSDSRLWGPIRAERLVARVLLRYWPPSRFGLP
jgi:signal peptidase I